MIRKFGLVLCVTAFIVSACGQQVTPNPPGYGTNGVQSGFMAVKFRVSATFNFSQYSYIIVFNTTGDGVTPRANATTNNWDGYSFAIVVSGGANGTATANAWSYSRPCCSSTQVPVLLPIVTTPQQLIFTPNSNGLGTEFTVTFSRAIASAFVTPSPTTGGSATPTTSASASPTSSASATASPTATPSGAVSNIWNYNLFVANGVPIQGQPAGTLVDSLGQGGPTDTSYTDPQNLNVSKSFDYTFYSIAGNHPSDQSADISGGEIINTP
jgi:hypothetical protein